MIPRIQSTITKQKCIGLPEYTGRREKGRTQGDPDRRESPLPLVGMEILSSDSGLSIVTVY